MGLIFAGLIGLKIFQPRGVSIYLDEHLQDEYIRYKNHAFDDLLDKKEYPDGNSPMTPFRFYNWFYNYYKLLHQVDEKDIAIDKSIQTLLNLERKVLDEYEKIKTYFLNKKQTLHDKKQRLNELFSKKQYLTQELERLKYYSSEIGVDKLPNGSSPETAREVIKQQVLLNAKINELNIKLHSIEEEMKNIEIEVSDLELDIKKLENKLNNHEEQAKKIESKRYELVSEKVQRYRDKPESVRETV